MIAEFELVKGPQPPQEFSDYLENHDPCFGKHFAKTAKECKECLAPVISEGKLLLLRDVCEAHSKGVSNYAQLVVLTTQDVIGRLERGQSVEEIFREVLGKADPKLQAAAARQLIALRFRYMKRNLKLPTPDLPTKKELVEYVRSQKVD